MEEIPLTNRWVASAGSARSATATYIGFAARNRRLLTLVGWSWLAFAVLFGAGFGGSPTLAARVMWGPVYALVPAAFVYAAVLTTLYLQTTTSFRQRLKAGAVLGSGFGEDTVLLVGPSGEHRLAREWIAAVQPRGDWVLMRQRAAAVITVWPRALFPDEDLAQLTGRPLFRRAWSAEERVEGDRDEQQ